MKHWQVLRDNQTIPPAVDILLLLHLLLLLPLSLLPLFVLLLLLLLLLLLHCFLLPRQHHVLLHPMLQ